MISELRPGSGLGWSRAVEHRAKKKWPVHQFPSDDLTELQGLLASSECVVAHAVTTYVQGYQLVKMKFSILPVAFHKTLRCSKLRTNRTVINALTAGRRRNS